jgi:hypothetical protein
MSTLYKELFGWSDVAATKNAAIAMPPAGCEKEKEKKKTKTPNSGREKWLPI